MVIHSAAERQLAGWDHRRLKPHLGLFAVALSVCSHLGCGHRGAQGAEVLEDSLTTELLCLLKEPVGSSVSYPLEDLRSVFTDAQERNFREAMGLAGQALVQIERGQLMAGSDRRDFILRGFFLLQRSLTECRQTAAAESPVGLFAYLNACLTLAYVGEIAVLNDDERLFDDVLVQLRYLRKRGHALYARGAGDSAATRDNQPLVFLRVTFCTASGSGRGPPLPIHLIVS